MNTPNNPIAEALSLQHQGRLSEAEALFRRILQVAPDEPASLYSLGFILMQRGELEEALRLFRHGIQTSPTFPHNWMGCANVLQAQGNKQAALEAYDALLVNVPDYVEALVNSGVILRDFHRHQEALARFNAALATAPEHLPALANAAILLTEFKESEKAISLFERLLALKPDFDYGLGLLLYEQLHGGIWHDFDALRERILEGVRKGERTCKTLALMSLSDVVGDHFLCARVFARHFCPKPQAPLWQGERYGHTRLRVAYVSPDLREHPVGHLMCGVFEQHDKSRFETIAISLGINDGSRLRARMEKAFDHFIDARQLNDREIAQQMRAMEVDVAIDLAGYTSDSRVGIFAHRPAPVHINYLGYPGTLGVDYMDYILADRHVIPEAHRPFYSEEVLYLPNAYLPTDASLQIAEETPSRASCGLPEQGAVFCSFSHDYKISPPLWRVWMSLLRRVPGSVLWLVSRNALTIGNFRQSAADSGIDPARIIFAARVPRVEDHLARYRLADVFLDTWPYNAHTTAADALMAGLPVVTYMGDSFPSRVAGSLLHAVDLPELVTHTWADYEELALRVATEPDLQQRLKGHLAGVQGRAALFDTQQFVRGLEQVLLDCRRS